MTYQAQGICKFVEEDIFEEGCQPETTQEMEFDLTFQANSLEELFDKIQEFHGVERENLLPDSCGEKGRLDVQVMEDSDGMTAYKRDIERWKRGEQRLFLADYTYQVAQVITVSLAG